MLSSENSFTPITDALLGHKQNYADGLDGSHLEVNPKRQLSVAGYMDACMNTFETLGLQHGDAHIIRNAGGVITDDVIRSLCLSQRCPGTREIVLLRHTDCGLKKVTEDDFKAEPEAEIGINPRWRSSRLQNHMLMFSSRSSDWR